MQPRGLKDLEKGAYCLSFWYHMYGTRMGLLRISMVLHVCIYLQVTRHTACRFGTTCMAKISDQCGYRWQPTTTSAIEENSGLENVSIITLRWQTI